MLSSRLDIMCSQEAPDLLVRGQCHREGDLRMEKLRPGEGYILHSRVPIK